MMKNGELTFNSPPYLVVIEATPSEITNWGWSIAQNKHRRTAVRFLRGGKMLDLPTCFDQFEAAFQFPYYFGRNWNAFDECITDLEWIMADSYVLIILDSQLVLIGESDDEFQLLTTALNDAGAEWSVSSFESDGTERLAKDFHVIFQCDSANKPSTLARLVSVGAHIQEFELE